MEALEAKRRHQLHHVLRHRALGVVGMVRQAGRLDGLSAMGYRVDQAVRYFFVLLLVGAGALALACMGY